MIILGSLSMIISMETGRLPMEMDQVIWDPFWMIYLMDKETLNMWIKMYIKDSLNKGKKKEKEFIISVKVLFSKELGKTISNLKVSSYCLMEILLSAHLEITIDMRVSTNTKMEIFIKGNGRDK